MKTLKIMGFIQLMLLSIISCAQNKNMKTEVDKIKELGRDSIIQLALDIHHNDFNKNNFDVISISANHKEVYVNFTNPIKYIPLNKKIRTDLTVSILRKSTSINDLTNPINFHSKGEIEYYKPEDEENKKVIQFVFNSIKQNPDSKWLKDVINNFNTYSGYNIKIEEKKNYYNVLVLNNYKYEVFSCKVKKTTGKVYEVKKYNFSKLPLPLEDGEEELQDLTHYFEEQNKTRAGKSENNSEITFKTLNQMDRNALVALAKTKVDTDLKLLNKKPFDYTTIDTKVLKNSTVILVYFEQSLKYVPLKSSHYYGFVVNLLEDDVQKLKRNSDPINSDFSYFIPSPKDIENIAFVKKAISYKKGQIAVVYEKEKHYEVGYETSGEKVDKTTGKVFDFWDRIFELEEDPLVEMK